MKFTDIHFGKILRELLQERGLNSHWLARVLGITERSARKVFGEKEISVDKLRKLSLELNTDLFIYFISEESALRLKAAQPGLQPEVPEQPAVLEKSISHMQDEIQSLRDALNELKVQLV